MQSVIDWSVTTQEPGSAAAAQRAALSSPWTLESTSPRVDVQIRTVVALRGPLPPFILTTGSEMETGAAVIDLMQPSRGPFRAIPGQVAGPGNICVVESRTNPAIWHGLIQLIAQVAAELHDAACAGRSCTVTITLEPAITAVVRPAA